MGAAYVISCPLQRLVALMSAMRHDESAQGAGTRDATQQDIKAFFG